MSGIGYFQDAVLRCHYKSGCVHESVKRCRYISKCSWPAGTPIFGLNIFRSSYRKASFCVDKYKIEMYVFGVDKVLKIVSGVYISMTQLKYFRVEMSRNM